MTKTRAQLETQIADDLARGDLTTQITEAVDQAILQYEQERFWFNQVHSQTATFSSSETHVDFSAMPKKFLEVDRVRVATSAGVNFYWEVTPASYASVMQAQETVILARPLEYVVYNNALQFDSKANRDYSLFIDGLVSLGSVASASFSTADTSAWFNDGRTLIRATAKADIFANLLEAPEKAAVFEALAQKELNKLRAKTNQKLGFGPIISEEF